MDDVGFLDNIKSKLNLGTDQQDDAAYDDYYGDGADAYAYGDETYQTAQGGYGVQGGYGDGNAYAGDSSNGVLGQTRRGEAESVAVYSRSGQPLGEQDRHASVYSPSQREAAYRPGAYDTPSSYASNLREIPSPDASTPYSSQTAARMSATLNNNPQLPAYILRPESYDDVETVVRRVRTRQPVALVFQGVRTEVAKRVLDFSYGFAIGLGAEVKELGDRVFMVLPPNCEVQEADLSKLRAEGYLKK